MKTVIALLLIFILLAVLTLTDEVKISNLPEAERAQLIVNQKAEREQEKALQQAKLALQETKKEELKVLVAKPFKDVDTADRANWVMGKLDVVRLITFFIGFVFLTIGINVFFKARAGKY